MRNAYLAKMAVVYAKMADQLPEYISIDGAKRMPRDFSADWSLASTLLWTTHDVWQMCAEQCYSPMELHMARVRLWTAVLWPNEPESRPVLDSIIVHTSAFRGWVDLLSSMDVHGYVPTIYADAGGRKDMLSLAIQRSGRAYRRAYLHRNGYAVRTPWGERCFN